MVIEDTDLRHAASFLTLPEVERAHFEKNFIKTAVCELRFPALLEFETKPPIQLQKELRREFPHYERQQSVSLGDVQDKEARYLFRSRKGEWLVSFKASAISIETSRYTHFAEFFAQIQTVVTKSKPLLDTDFFTRVGLRYINELTIDDGKLEGWINDVLIGPLVEGVYGTVDRFVTSRRRAGRLRSAASWWRERHPA